MSYAARRRKLPLTDKGGQAAKMGAIGVASNGS